MARFEDPSFQLPIGVARQLSREPELDQSLLERLLEEVSEQADGAGLSADRRLRALDVRADLLERLGHDEALGSTLVRMRELEDSSMLRWRLFRHHLEQEEWSAAADVLAEIPASAEHLRPALLRLLARAGRVDEVLALLEAPVARGEADAATGEDGQSSTEEAVYLGGEAGFYTAADLFSYATVATGLAWLLREGGHLEAAEKLFRRALEHEPGHTVARRAVVYLYGTQEDRLAYEEEWRSKQTEYSPMALANQAADLMASSQFERAYEVLSSLAAEHPDDALWGSEPAWYNFGIAAYRSEQWADSARAFRRAVQLNDGRYQSTFFLAMALVKLGECAEALPLLERSVELDPTQKAPHYQLWVCHRQLGNADAATHHRSLYDSMP
ncbi:MAG: hypothetical protein DWQ30_04250 [Acidobacteria bacterium]|nr:MAG: hypothetical protein DWQ30_04250 [Acidobacteriota bacterium]